MYRLIRSAHPDDGSGTQWDHQRRCPGRLQYLVSTFGVGNQDQRFQMTTDDRFLISVSETLPSLQECYHFVSSDPACGAVSTFVGITRDHFHGKRVLKLSYEGYVPMAVKELKKLCIEATRTFDSISRIAVVHILGDCPVSQASVIIACSSPHRTESIRCCEYLINELKARIPIWKLEVYDDSSVWKENVEWNDGKQQRIMVQQQQLSDETPAADIS